MRREWFPRERRWPRFGYRSRRKTYGTGDGQPVGPTLVPGKKTRRTGGIDLPLLLVLVIVATPFLLLGLVILRMHSCV